jgi:hypothetical protein
MADPHTDAHTRAQNKTSYCRYTVKNVALMLSYHATDEDILAKTGVTKEKLKILKKIYTPYV